MSEEKLRRLVLVKAKTIVKSTMLHHLPNYLND